MANNPNQVAEALQNALRASFIGAKGLVNARNAAVSSGATTAQERQAAFDKELENQFNTGRDLFAQGGSVEDMGSVPYKPQLTTPHQYDTQLKYATLSPDPTRMTTPSTGFTGGTGKSLFKEKQQKENWSPNQETKNAAQRQNVNTNLAMQGVRPEMLNASINFANSLGLIDPSYIGPNGLYDTDENGNLKILGLDALGNTTPGEYDPAKIKANYSLGKNSGKYDGIMDADDDGMVTAEEQEAFYKNLEDQLIKTYGQEAYDAAGYNREGGNFRIQDGVLQNYDYTTGDWTNSMYDLNDDGTFNLTIDDKQALDDDSRQMAMYMMLNSMNGVTGDSWGARQFYHGDGADDWWWRAMNNSPVSGHYDYMRNAVDENGNSIWGDDGQMSMDEWLAWRDAWDGDMMNADVLRQQALYGNVGLGMNSTNSYLAANGIDLNPYGDAMMYLDAASLSDDQKAQLGLDDSMADQYGRFRITAEGNPNAVGLMNLMSASSLLADGGMTDALNQDELNQLMELAGLSDRFNVDPTGVGGVADEFAPWNAQGYDPEYFRTYQWDEFNPETEMPRFDLDMFNNQLAADYLNRNFGFKRMEA